MLYECCIFLVQKMLNFLFLCYGSFKTYNAQKTDKDKKIPDDNLENMLSPLIQVSWVISIYLVLVEKIYSKNTKM